MATGELFRWDNRGTLAESPHPAFTHVCWTTEFAWMFHRTAPTTSLTEDLHGEKLGSCWATSHYPKARRGATCDVLASVFQRSTNFEARKDRVSKRPLLEYHDVPPPSSE
ncbi:hypothetical protein BU25DRAFT_416019 [Macroventuria anomochaeta]|uniref:Uncharacterized protein n=1 Tax=Macroventuria anomochaeta TaxID=301207 RepID=A0ACB6RIA6_9PLEO|nr:uncharacterized protein BU25DRAFT_416019 [Macroventuria anomochaeta]KAF2621645.1 hypothetical protein BU25DRAFT_416019 [Macroventuria anomochaeta]